MRKCGTCKYWDYDGSADDFELCIAIDDQVDRTKLTLAEIHGSDACFGMLFTKAEFGCVLWEAKDGKEAA